MKQKVEMFTVKCDNCGKLFEDEYNGYSCWGDFNDVWENASESNWITEDDINHYCPECYSYDDNDNLVLKEIKVKTKLHPSEDNVSNVNKLRQMYHGGTGSEDKEKEPTGMPEFSGRDWTMDFSHENGNYLCNCTVCGKTFYGHKRRVICKSCNE